MEEYKLTQDRLRERVGNNRTTITNYFRLLRLPAEVQMGIKNKTILPIPVLVLSASISKVTLILSDEKF